MGKFKFECIFAAFKSAKQEREHARKFSNAHEQVQERIEIRINIYTDKRLA